MLIGVFMSVGYNEVVNYYNNMLPKMEWYHSGKNARLNRANKSLSQIIKPNISVLDVGCGTGITSIHMAKLGAYVTAVDISPVLIDYAKKNSHHENIEYIVSDISEFNIDKAFDVIVFVDVIEHLPMDVFIDFLRRIDLNSGDETIIYVNIPVGDFLVFMAENHCDSLQILEVAYDVDNLCGLFYGKNFKPIHMSIYGIDVNFQYNEFIFARSEFLESYYKNNFKI